MPTHHGAAVAAVTNPALALRFPAHTFDAWCRLKEARDQPIDGPQLEQLGRMSTHHPMLRAGPDEPKDMPSIAIRIWAALCRVVRRPAPMHVIDGEPGEVAPPQPADADEITAIRARNSLARRLTHTGPSGGDAA